jgi:dinuclear metal center YbgI/SA1388 family protein
MDMLARDIIERIYELAPRILIDSWDNTGLQLGREDKEVSKVLLTLDLTREAVNDAINHNVDMIITHHPVFFDKIKSLTANSNKGKVIYDIIKNDIVVLSAHTNLDVCIGGVNDVLANLFELNDISILKKTYQEKLFKLVVYVPDDYSERVRDAISNEGAGWIGNYSHCTYNLKGIGTFMPREGTNPFIGSTGKLEEVKETRIETIVKESIVKNVIDKMIEAHPYEEVAYDIYPLVNAGKAYGYGRIGYLKEEIDLKTFANTVKDKLNCNDIRVYGDLNKRIRKVAVCGGSGGDFVEEAKRKGADVYITGDIKYHTGQLSKELDMVIIDAGHYNTERIILPYLKGYLEKIFNKDIEVIISDINSAPYTVI